MKQLRIVYSLLILLASTSAFGRISSSEEIVSGSSNAIPYIFINESNSTENNQPNIDTTSARIENKAKHLTDYVKTNNRLIGNLIPNETYTLPIGLYKNIGGVEFIIALDEFELHPGGGMLKAYMVITFPGSTKELAFYADSVIFGPGSIDAAQLQLISDKTIKYGNFSMVFKKEQTAIDWDCNGYKSTTIAGDILFPSELLKPIDNKKELKGSFYTNFTDINDLYFGISLPAFEIKGLPDFEIHPENLFLDLSDLRNPTGLKFPDGYFPANQPTTLNNLWRGAYIPSFKIKLPKSFSKESSRIEIGAQNLIIDDQGLTGFIYAARCLEKDKGNISGWNISIDVFGIKLLKNQLTEFEIGGELAIPISEKSSAFRYKAIVDTKGELLFNVANKDTVKADLWCADLILYKNSIVEIKREATTKDYKPKAILHGNMNINASESVSLAKIEFEKLQIQTVSPIVSIGACKASSGRLKEFPVYISEIGFKSDEAKKRIGLDLTGGVNLMSDKEGGFTAEGSFTIWAKETVNNLGNTKYKFDKVQINGFLIDVNQGAFSLHGEIRVYDDDPTYGKGFKGNLNARFEPGITVGASGQFGTVKGFRYWYVDALASTPAGIPIFAGVAIYGFGGGISYKMKVTEPPVILFSEKAETKKDQSPKPGTFLSGTTYTPDNTLGLGLKSTVILGTHTKPEAVNGQVSFRIQFTAKHSVEYIKFTGMACMAAKLGTNPVTAPIGITMDITYNFTKKELYGISEAYVNMGIVKGLHEKNKAGTVVFLFNNQEWYINVGSPDKRLGVKVLNLMQMGNYFMVGTNIPHFPAPPEEVLNIIDNKEVQTVDKTLAATGNGFAFGSMFNVNTGEKEFLIFFGSLAIGAGFDIMLRDYGTAAYCEGSTPPLGINGWYAMGQAYAYLAGKIGVQFKLFGKKKKKEILSIAAAALLTAKLPNPMFFEGQAGGNYSILGGLVKGSCKFKFSIGDQCEIMGANPLGNISVISEISPAEGATDISVFNTPQVAFNMPIGEEFEMLDENEKNQKYKIELSHFNVMVNGVPFNGENKWNNDRTVISFETKDIYPSQTQVTVETKVKFLTLKDGKWIPFTVNGTEQFEEKTQTFTTGDRPDHIPSQCVEYVYPIQGMANLYWRESNSGYIQLTHDFGYLLNKEPEWQNTVVFFANSQNSQQVPFLYANENRRLTFTIPNNLSNETIYNIKITKQPVVTANSVDANVKSVITEQTDEYETTEADIEGVRSVDLERKLYQIDVRTSRFATFKEKMNSIAFQSYTITDQVLTGVSNLQRNGRCSEGFDQVDLNLIHMTFSLANNKWFTGTIRPLVYEGYPLHSSLRISYRDTSVLGLIPLKAGSIVSWSNNFNIENYAAGATVTYSCDMLFFKYTGNLVMYYDYIDLRDKSARYYNPSSPQSAAYQRFITGHFAPIKLFVGDRVNTTLKYILPGTNSSNSVAAIDMVY
ncbi:MAG: hypothetical protein JXR57_15380 [Bacteroidales bacterium]|nr:hypothetical protein [Bacteroidales bacterium]